MRAMFGVAGKLFGLTFVEKPGMPLYHPDVRLFEVLRGDTLVGLLSPTTLLALQARRRVDERLPLVNRAIPRTGRSSPSSATTTTFKPPAGQPALLTF